LSFPIALTIDIHPGDKASSIRRCHDFLSENNIPATFLISTAILHRSEERAAIKFVAQGRHELGTHAHYHDGNEAEALMSGDDDQLGFLRISKELFQEVLGNTPLSFRSPSWCGLGHAALNELVRLGYRVDCSSTPQRPGILSGYPLKNPWLLTPRQPHWLRDELLEVPTSTLLLPLASPSFAMLRSWGSKLLLTLLTLEVEKSKNMVLVLGFDISDFDRFRASGKASKRWAHLVPLATGGFQWRYWLRTYNPERIFRTTHAIFERLGKSQFSRLSDIYATHVKGPD